MPLKTKSAPKEHLGLTTRQKMKKYRAFYIMFIPLFLCLILFSYLPMFGILYAFTDYTPFKPAQFVGLQNFQKLFSQAGFWKAFFNTLQISITKLVIDTLGSIVLALLLDELHFKWFKKISQTIIYIPHFMSWVVVASIFTMFLSPKNGLINGVITALGGDSIYFLANEKWWRPIFYMIAVWKDIGWGTIIYIAALSGVDMEQHEAAVLDGATRFQRVIYLTLPAISGTIVTVFILNLAKVLNLFDPVWVLQNSIYTRQTALQCSFSARLDTALRPGWQAGITGYYDEKSYCKFGLRGTENGTLAELTVRSPEGKTVVRSAPAACGTLRMEADGLTRRFYLDDTMFAELPRAEFLADEGRGCQKRFTGSMMGLYAVGADFTAKFGELSMENYTPDWAL